MNVAVNGAEREIPEGMTVADLVAEIGLSERNVVAELNGEPVERSRFAETVLASGDVLEIVRAVPGG